MAINSIQTSFASGELSPNLYARVDFQKYESGAALLRNFFVMAQGGAKFRPGTEFLADLTDAVGHKLIPFVVSTAAGYMMVASEEVINIYFEGVFVTSVVTPYQEADLPLLKYAQSADVMTLTHPTYPPANLTRTSDTTFSYDVIDIAPDIDPPIITDFVAPHSGPYNFGYLVTAVDLDGKEESLASNIGVKHSEGMDEKTNRVIGLTWTPPAQPVSRYNVYKWGPIDAVTLNPATVWGFIGSALAQTFTDNNIAPDFSKQSPVWGDPFSGGQFQSITVTGGGSGYDGVAGDWTHIPYVPLEISGDGTDAAGWAVIDHADGTIVGVFLTNSGKNYTTASITANGEGGTGASFSYSLSDIEPLYPACCAYVQQRLAFGGPNLKPETLAISQPGRYSNFCTTPVALDTDAIGVTIASLEVNSIKALVPAAYGLLIFTSGGSFLLNGGSPYAALTPASVSVQQQSFTGTNDIPPLRINYDVLYIQAKGNRARNFSFNWQRQTYSGSDISLLASHLFDGFETVAWTWAEEPDKLVYSARSDGRLLTLTYLPDQEIFAWARHDTQGEFLDVACVQEGERDAVYVLVKRHVDLGGSEPCWRVYLERFAPNADCCIAEAWHLDSALSLPQQRIDTPIYLSALTGDITITSYDPCLPDPGSGPFPEPSVYASEQHTANDRWSHDGSDAFANFSPSGGLMGWYQPTAGGEPINFEMWNRETRTSIGVETLADALQSESFTPWFAITDDGTVYARYDIGGHISGDASLVSWGDNGAGAFTDLGLCPAFPGLIYSTKAGNGDEYIFMPHFSFGGVGGYYLIHGDAGPATAIDTDAITGEAFILQTIFTDGYGSVWVAGGQGDLGGTKVGLIKLYDAPGSPGPDFLIIDAPFSDASVDPHVLAFHVLTDDIDHFVIWFGFPSPGFFTVGFDGIVTHSATLPYTILLPEMTNHAPDQATLWLDNSQYSCADLTLIQTLPYETWDGYSSAIIQNGSMYDPINNALLVGLEDANNLFAWLFFPVPGFDCINTNCGIIHITEFVSSTTLMGTVEQPLDEGLLLSPDDPDGAVRPIPATDWFITDETQVVTGLDHLEGKEVWALSEGRVLGPFTVTDGSVDIGLESCNILVGLKYTGQIKTLYLTAEGIQAGSEQGKRKFLPDVTLRVECTRGLSVGPAFDRVYPITALIPPPGSVALITGDVYAQMGLGWDDAGEVCIVQDSPLPATVNGVIVGVVAGDTGR